MITKGTKEIPICWAFLFLLTYLLFGFSVSAAQAQTAKGQPPAKVVVQPVAKAEIKEFVTLVGTARAHREALVASQIEGWVEKIFFQEGKSVRAGGQLAQLESKSLRIQLQGARASYEESEERLKQAQADLKRLRPLFKSRSVAEKTLQDAQYEVNARRARAISLDAVIKRLEDQLAKKIIRAPFSGWIAEQHAEIGEWVEKGGAVAKLVDLSTIHMRVPVPERYLPRLKMDDGAAVILDALPARKFRGHIVAIFPQGDDQSRTFPVEVTVPNSDGVIRAGMLCRVDLGVGEPRMALMVHKDALVLGGPSPAVYVVNDSLAHLVNIEVLGYQGELVEVRGELSPGDLVVVRGNERIRDEQPVMILSDPSNSSSPESSGQRKTR